MTNHLPIVPIVERILRHVDKTDPDGHWLWTGWKVSGYGYIREGGRGSRLVVAHRVLWESVNGPVPEGKECGHRCPTGARKDCVNPAHIQAITHSENISDYYGGWCKRRLHRLDDPANVLHLRNGRRYCRICTEHRSAVA